MRVPTNDPEYQDTDDICPWCGDPKLFPLGEDEANFIYTLTGAPSREDTPIRDIAISRPSYTHSKKTHREGTHSSHCSLNLRPQSSHVGSQASSPRGDIVAKTSTSCGNPGSSITPRQQPQSIHHGRLSHSPKGHDGGKVVMRPPSRLSTGNPANQSSNQPAWKPEEDRVIVENFNNHISISEIWKRFFGAGRVQKYFKLGPVRTEAAVQDRQHCLGPTNPDLFRQRLQPPTQNPDSSKLADAPTR